VTIAVENEIDPFSSFYRIVTVDISSQPDSKPNGIWMPLI
jgi:hypothetical protein